MKRVFSLILFSHLILRVNCTLNYKPLKGLITGNLNLSSEMVMQMGRFSLWKISLDFGAGGCAGVFVKALLGMPVSGFGPTGPLQVALSHSSNCCAQPRGPRWGQRRRR